MSAAISTKNVIKRFGKNTVINGLPPDVRPGEFFTLLGPSGCGKTTPLRTVIGFNSIKGDEIKIDDKVINNIPTSKESTNMVFQNYAVFLHMPVWNNIAFGLRNHKASQDQIESQVDEILGVVKIDHLKERMPPKLSDGQQQCTTLTRATVIHSEVLFMGEPLSNLDAKLRVEMRSATKRIQQQVGITTIYVAHDQEEALAVSDHIAVMNGGVIQQIDALKNVYQWSPNIFVSTFIRLSGVMDGRIEARDEQMFLHIGDYNVSMGNFSYSVDDGQTVKVSVRPKELIINREGSDDIPAAVQSGVFLGITTYYFVETADGRGMEVIQNSDIWDIIPDHTLVRLDVQPHKISVLIEDGSHSLIIRRDHS